MSSAGDGPLRWLREGGGDELESVSAYSVVAYAVNCVGGDGVVYSAGVAGSENGACGILVAWACAVTLVAVLALGSFLSHFGAWLGSLAVWRRAIALRACKSRRWPFGAMVGMPF